MARVHTTKIKEPRVEGDFYPTPAYAVTPFFDALPLLAQEALFGPVLDPGAGEGDLLIALRDWRASRFPGRPGGRLSAIELDPARAALCAERGLDASCGSYLDPGRVVPEASFVLMNPPFQHNLEFIEKALTTSGPDGCVAALLRLGFMSSKKRRPFHQRYPSDAYILDTRPTFQNPILAPPPPPEPLPPVEGAPQTIPEAVAEAVVEAKKRGKSKTDLYDYAWFFWSPWSSRRWSVISLTRQSKAKGAIDAPAPPAPAIPAPPAPPPEETAQALLAEAEPQEKRRGRVALPPMPLISLQGSLFPGEVEPRGVRARRPRVASVP